MKPSPFAASQRGQIRHKCETSQVKRFLYRKHATTKAHLQLSRTRQRYFCLVFLQFTAACTFLRCKIIMRMYLLESGLSYPLLRSCQPGKGAAAGTAQVASHSQLDACTLKLRSCARQSDRQACHEPQLTSSGGSFGASTPRVIFTFLGGRALLSIGGFLLA